MRCAAELTRASEIPGFPDEPNGLDYELFCNENMRAFSVISSKELVYFTPEVSGFTPEGAESGEIFSCEGPIPGHGFGCRALGSTNQVQFNNRFRGQIITTEDPCPEFKGEPRLDVWMTATTTQLTVTGSTFTTSSQPFRFKNNFNCPKPKPRSHRAKGGGNRGKGGRN